MGGQSWVTFDDINNIGMLAGAEMRSRMIIIHLVKMQRRNGTAKFYKS